jgi:hypothetical protein
MLGDKIGEMSGKISSQRVLSIADGRLKMETSMQGNGTLLGAKVKEIGTYITVFLADGTQHGEGRGVMMTADGEIATWTGHGVGKANKDGTASYRGSLIFQTMPGQLSRLNNIAVVFEYTVDAHGDTHSDYWEWK